MAEKVAIVTESNWGLGFAVVKGLCLKFKGVVYLTAINEASGKEAVENLNAIGLYPEFHQLDVTDSESVRNLAKFIERKHQGFDVLVNNAAILKLQHVYPSYDEAKQNINTSYRSLLTVEKYLYPLLRDGARVVNISSACGHLSNLKNGSWIKMLQSLDLTTDQLNYFVEEYLESVRNGTFDKNNFADDGKHADFRVSHIAITALTKIQQRQYPKISINAVHPGHVKNEMSSNKGDLEPDEAAKVILYLILEASPKLKGTFMWQNGKIIDWFDVDPDFAFKCPKI